MDEGKGVVIEIEPTVMVIRDIIDKIRKGTLKLYVPSFQRDFVWDEDDVKDFFDSIIKGYPVGAIILWKHDSYDLEEDQFAEPLITDYKNSSIPTGEKYYVLDGQQRLTSIMLLSHGWKIKRGKRYISTGRITYWPSSRKLVKSESTGVDLSELVRAFIEGKLESVTENYRGYKEHLEFVAQSIMNYKIPIYKVVTYGDFSKAVLEMSQAFIRVNTEGVRIGGVELQISLLAGYFGGSFGRLIRNAYNEIYNNFNVDVVPFFRFVISILGLKQTDISRVARDSPDSFKRRLYKALGLTSTGKDLGGLFEDVVRNSKDVFIKTLYILEEELGKAFLSMLPSSITLVPIAAYIYGRNIEDPRELGSEEKNDILSWLIVSNFRGRYTTHTNKKLQEDLDIVKNSIKNGNTFPLDELLDKIRNKRITERDVLMGNQRAVTMSSGRTYLFLLYVALVKEGADDWTGCPLRKREYDDLNKHHIFPVSIFKNNKEANEKGIDLPDDPAELKTIINGLGNITFISKDVNQRDIRGEEPFIYLNSFNKSSLAGHFIPMKKELWSLVNFEQFKEERVKLMYKALSRHFPKVFGG